MPPTVETPARLTVPSWWPWALGAMVGLVVLGPGLAPGSLLNLDLLVTPHIPVPNGVWGLGPALSQRVPLFAGLAALSAVVGGPVAVKAFFVACTAAGTAGAVRLARLAAPADLHLPAPALVAAGVLWAAGPWALTRMGVGHLNLVWVVAVLPWALPRLCRPGDDLASTFLASLALAIGGPGGGTIGLTVAGIGLVRTVRGRALVPSAAAVLAPHVVWVLPTVVLLWAGAGVNGAGDFATRPDGVPGWPAVLAGAGFWRPDQQVGATGVVGGLAGVALVGMAGIGLRRVLERRPARSWPVTATVVAGVGLVLTLASAVPGVRELYRWASELPVGAPLRESQRFLALWLVWLAPTVAIGGAHLAARATAGRARTVVAAIPLVVVAAISVPGWWGIGGRLEPVAFPPSWAAARQVIDDRPGTAVALPWSQYPQISFAGGRQVFNPMPDYLGGDVISSYDPRFDPARPSQEQVDGRAIVVDDVVRRLRAGADVADDLAELGVRWVVLAHEPGWESYRAVADDAGLRLVLDLPDLELFEVRGWPGPSSGAGGRDTSVRRPLPPVILTDAQAGDVLNLAGAPGWVQGWSRPAAVTDDGRLAVSGDAGVVWFWPAIVLVSGYGAVAGVAIWAARSRRARTGRLLARHLASD